MAGIWSRARLSPYAGACSATALAAIIVLASIDASLAEPASVEPGSVAARFAAADSEQPAAAAPVPAAPEPPKDVLRGAAVSVAPITGGTDARSHYRGLIEKEAATSGLAPQIAEAVMAVESGFNAAATGSAGEIGLMQILPSTARMLGFAGSPAELAVPETNIHYGVTYLAKAWRLASGDLCTAVMKYRAGHGETRFSFLSVNYCLAVRAKLMALGFPVTGSVPVPTFGEASGSGASGSPCKRKCTTIARVGHVNIAALNSQLSTLVVQVRGGR
jgi:soluble lytic murein transglycosylase-like protein